MYAAVRKRPGIGSKCHKMNLMPGFCARENYADTFSTQENVCAKNCCADKKAFLEIFTFIIRSLY